MIVSTLDSREGYAHVSWRKPPRGETPYLEFMGLAHIDNPVNAPYGRYKENVVALVQGRNKQKYALSQRDVTLLQKKHAGEYGLPHMQLAQHQFARHALDQRWIEPLRQAKDRLTLGAALGLTFATAATLVTAAFTNLWNHAENDILLRHTNGPESKVGSQAFSITASRQAAALGDPDKGAATWQFNTLGAHEACAITPFRPAGWHPYRLSVFSAYERECRPVEAWPKDSVQSSQYATAYQAYLQHAFPKQQHTPQSVEKLITAHRTYMALLPQ